MRRFSSGAIDDAAGERRQRAGDALEQRRLAGPVGADDGGAKPAGNSPSRVMHRRVAVVAEGEIVEANGFHRITAMTNHPQCREQHDDAHEGAGRPTPEAATGSVPEPGREGDARRDDARRGDRDRGDDREPAWTCYVLILHFCPGSGGRCGGASSWGESYHGGYPGNHAVASIPARAGPSWPGLSRP